MANTIPLGPWLEGADGVHDEYEDVFQLSKERPARALAAVNVDWREDGWPDRRAGTTNRRTGTNYLSLFSGAGLLLLQDQGTIYSIDPDDSWSATSVVAGLDTSAKVEFYEFNNEVYYTNGISFGKIASDESTPNWGLTNTSGVSLGTTAGDLPAGRYIVIVTAVDANDFESGVYGSDSVVLNGSTDLTVNVSSIDSNATHVNIYVSPANQQVALWNQKVAVGSLPATITDARGESSRVPKHMGLRGPFACDFISSFLGYLFLVKDNVIFRSRGLMPNLFRPRTELFTFPHNIQTVAGLYDGFYVATEKTLHWVSGRKPTDWRNKQIESGEYARGYAKVSGALIPKLQTSEDVVLMVSQEGTLIAGLPGGQVVYLLDDKIEFASSPTTASIVYLKRNELKQLFMLVN